MASPAGSQPPQERLLSSGRQTQPLRGLSPRAGVLGTVALVWEAAYSRLHASLPVFGGLNLLTRLGAWRTRIYRGNLLRSQPKAVT